MEAARSAGRGRRREQGSGSGSRAGSGSGSRSGTRVQVVLPARGCFRFFRGSTRLLNPAPDPDPDPDPDPKPEPGPDPAPESCHLPTKRRVISSRATSWRPAAR